MCFAHVLLILSVSFFAGMSALILIRARQEAHKLESKNNQVSPAAKRRRRFC
jgi:hypothetical protein